MSKRPQLFALYGFLALLVLVFAVSYAVGVAVAPDAPREHRVDEHSGRGH
ncbi:hypothetical protein ACIBKX_34980 [Streptomyces sp. NPDC050658]